LPVPGLLAGDPYVKTLPEDSIGVLAAVRNCWFKQPVLPESAVEFFIQCRQVAPLLVQVSAVVKVADADVAKLEIALAYAPRTQLLASGGVTAGKGQPAACIRLTACRR
jgi:3-hydroxyacyl-[acyl-carrier-protein] dehydratase